MRALLLMLLFCSVSAERFVVHIGYHSDVNAAAFSTANNVTGNHGVNINCPKDQANNFMMGGTIILLCTWILCKLYENSESPRKKE